MVKKNKVYISMGIIAMGLLFLIEHIRPKRINWYPSFVSHHKIPYGTYVLSDLMKKYFPSKTRHIHKSPFEFLKNNDSVNGTYFFVDNTVHFEENELNALLDWVSRGNSLFVASNGFEDGLLDTLNLQQSSIHNGNSLKPVFYHELANPRLKTGAVSFEKDYYTLIFSKIDTVRTTVLGQVHAAADNNNAVNKSINMVKQSFGQGEIILSTFPKAFTNYFILKDTNRTYTAGLLSYLDENRPIFVDNHHKSGKSFYTSPMYLFLNTKEFKWAYYLLLIGTLIYIVFEGKRKQRAIPVINPPKNQTLAFTGTIAAMYFESGAQKQIIEYKIAHFMEYIRSRLHMATQDLSEKFIKDLAVRSNNELGSVQKLFQMMELLGKKNQITNIELKQLNKKIEAFKANIDGKQ